jgi:hypothetical protein
MTDVKHSRLGIASLWLFGILGLAVALGYYTLATPTHGDGAGWGALGTLAFLAGLIPLLILVGFGLGLAGLLIQRDRRRVTAVVGMALHLLAVPLVVVAAKAARAQKDAAYAAEDAKWNDANTEPIRELEAPDRLRLVYTAYLAARDSRARPPRQLEELKPFVGRGRKWVGKWGLLTESAERLTEKQRTEILTSPRDRQPFTISWNEDVRVVGPLPVLLRPLAWENTADSREGRFVVTTRGETLYVKADEFRKLQGAERE